MDRGECDLRMVSGEGVQDWYIDAFSGRMVGSVALIIAIST